MWIIQQLQICLLSPLDPPSRTGGIGEQALGLRILESQMDKEREHDNGH